MPVPTSKQLSEELSVFDIKCGDDLLDKMLEQCITHRIQEDDVVLEWVAFSTKRGALPLSLDNLHLFELEVLNKKVEKSRQTAVKKELRMSNTRDFNMQEHVASRAAFPVPTSSASKAAIAVPTSPASGTVLAFPTSPASVKPKAMPVPTSKQLSEELSVFDIKCGDDLLDKMLEQCITHRIQEDDVVLEWVAFSTKRGALPLSLDNLHLFELEVLNKKVGKSRQTAVKKEHRMSNTRDFSMQEHVASRAAFAVPTSSASKAAIAVPTSPASDNRLDLKLIEMHDDLTRRPEIVGGKRPLVTPQRYHTSTSPDKDRMENPKEPKARKFSTCNRDDLVEHLLQKK